MEQESVLKTEATIDDIVNHRAVILKTEYWLQDPHNSDLWHGENGVIINSEALKYRQEFFEIVKKYH